DSSSNQIITAGSEPQIKLIETILAQLQDPSAAQAPRETKIFEVGRAEELTRIQPLIQQLYQDQWKSKDAGDPADAQILPDAQNGRLIVTGKPEHIRHIETIFAQVSSPATNNLPRETRVYELNTTSAGELATTVKTLYDEQLKARAIPAANRAMVLPDV